MLTRTRTNTANDPVRAFASEIDRFFNAGLEPVSQRRGLVPPINAFHNDDAITFQAELPGFSLDDIEIAAAPEELTIRGHRAPALPEDTQPLRLERAAGRFERTLPLPFPVDTDNATASLDNGVLTVTLPKSSSARVRRIAINTQNPNPTTTNENDNTDT